VLKEENIDKTMDQTENTSISPSEDGITVKKRGRGCPIKHKLPCAVLSESLTPPRKPCMRGHQRKRGKETRKE